MKRLSDIDLINEEYQKISEGFLNDVSDSFKTGTIIQLYKDKDTKGKLIEYLQGVVKDPNDQAFIGILTNPPNESSLNRAISILSKYVNFDVMKQILRA